MNPIKYYRYLTLAILTALVATTACDVNNGDNKGTKGHFTVQLTDAPAAYEAVNIDIQKVQIKETADENGKDNGWITLNNTAGQVNLLDLRNGNTIRIGDEDLSAGTYHQIRLILGSDNNVVINGEKFPLKTPSAQQSGLKLNIDADVKANENYNLLIDFDAGQSIVLTGSSKYILKPVLHAVNLEKTAAISGTVQPGDVQTSVMAVTGGDTLSTITGDNGNFQIMGTADGTYAVHFAPSGDTYADTTVADVTVENHEDVDMGTIALHNQ